MVAVGWGVDSRAVSDFASMQLLSNMTASLRFGLCAASLAISAADVRASFLDTFPGSSLDPAWTLSFGGGAPETTWTPVVAAGELQLGGFGDLTQGDGNWGRAYLTRAVTPTAGDFYLSMVFNWNYGSEQAIQNLYVELLDADGDVVAHMGIHDQQVAHSPGYLFSGGDTPVSVGTGYGSLNVVSGGSRTMLLSRVGGALSGNWDGTTIYSDFASVSSGVVSSVRIHLADYWYSAANTETRPIAIEALQFSTTAIPEPADAGLGLGVVAASLMALRRSRRRA